MTTLLKLLNGKETATGVGVMIDPKKQYRTRDGREVRIYAVDGGGSLPVHGAIKNTYGWEPYQWIKDGRSYLKDGPEDLIEVRPRIQREVWVNVYPDNTSDAVGATAYYMKQYADQHAFKHRIACVKMVIDCDEGEGL
jgi:hypothetical protein